MTTSWAGIRDAIDAVGRVAMAAVVAGTSASTPGAPRTHPAAPA
jgi:hypothetical protein